MKSTHRRTPMPHFSLDASAEERAPRFLTQLHRCGQAPRLDFVRIPTYNWFWGPRRDTNNSWRRRSGDKCSSGHERARDLSATIDAIFGSTTQGW
jgi:hypothetical protein